MKKINGVLFLSIFVFGTLAALTAEAHDELYYSAAICTPVWQHGFDGSGEQGFRWNVGGAFWENRDVDNEEWLVCPIPFDRSKSGAFEVRTVVFDGHNSKSVLAQATRQTNTGQPVLAGATGSGGGFVGPTTLFLTIQPASGDRWINLYVTLPRTQGSSESRVLGFRVCRNCD